MSPEMSELLDALEDSLARGEIPVAYARCTMKDEAVKPGKAARIFTILSAAFNILETRVMSPVFAFMRKYPEYFECMVGIDMSGTGGDLIVEILKRV